MSHRDFTAFIEAIADAPTGRAVGNPWSGYTYLDTDEVRDSCKRVLNAGYRLKEYVLSCPIPDIKKVIFNDPATIVLWNDGTKTVVKAHGEEFDPEKGLAMAIVKKLYGNKGNYFNKIKKWLPKEENDPEAKHATSVDKVEKALSKLDQAMGSIAKSAADWRDFCILS